jgi:Lon-like ATP-dependent protease
MMKRGQPYLGAFLLKDKSSPSSASTSTKATSTTSDSASTSTSEDNKEDSEPIVIRETRDEDDKDVIDSLDEVYDVGVFCQVTSVFAAVPAKSDSPPSPGPSKDKDGAATTLPQEEALTAVLYPHRRIKITELVKAGPGGEQQQVLKVDEKDVEWIDHVEVGEQKIELPVTPPASPLPAEEGSCLSFSLSLS